MHLIVYFPKQAFIVGSSRNLLRVTLNFLGNLRIVHLEDIGFNA